MTKKNFITNEQVRNQYITNVLLERKLWLRRLMDPRRDIDDECGHPLDIGISDYIKFYTRGDVAQRVVKVWPEESWAERPFVYESEDPEDTTFETEWTELERRFNLLPTLYHADVLSGIGRYGIILLGLDDGQALSTPLPEVVSKTNLNGEDPEEDSAGPEVKRKLLYIRVFDESCVTIGPLNTDAKNHRFGKPESYTIKFEETTNLTVHWTRTIHIADNRISSEFYGQPRIQLVANRLLDLAKIAGGAGEMFWKGGFPGISLETLPEVMGQGGVEIDIKSTKTQMEAYMNGLQRYIATVGMKANSLTVQVADPTPHAELQLKLIAIALSIPWRVFVGSESAQLASEQDSRTWNRRLARRRNDYVSPYIIRPFVQRLIDCGIVSKPAKLLIEWPDLNTPSEKDKASVATGLTQAMMDYVSSGSDALMPPFHFFTLVLGMSEYEARAVIEAAKTQETNGIDLTAVRAQIAAPAVTAAPGAAKGKGAPGSSGDTTTVPSGGA
jgi:uncharacterized protein